MTHCDRFPAWQGYMNGGFSVLLFGLGDKGQLAEAFVTRVSVHCTVWRWHVTGGKYCGSIFSFFLLQMFPRVRLIVFNCSYRSVGLKEVEAELRNLAPGDKLSGLQIKKQRTALASLSKDASRRHRAARSAVLPGSSQAATAAEMVFAAPELVDGAVSDAASVSSSSSSSSSSRSLAMSSDGGGEFGLAGGKRQRAAPLASSKLKGVTGMGQHLGPGLVHRLQAPAASVSQSRVEAADLALRQVEAVLLFHSMDQLLRRNPRVLPLLVEALARSPSLRIVATMDHIDSPLLINNASIVRARFVSSSGCCRSTSAQPTPPPPAPCVLRACAIILMY
jgi:hypothetical protein